MRRLNVIFKPIFNHSEYFIDNTSRFSVISYPVKFSVLDTKKRKKLFIRSLRRLYIKFYHGFQTRSSVALFLCIIPDRNISQTIPQEFGTVQRYLVSFLFNLIFLLFIRKSGVLSTYIRQNVAFIRFLYFKIFLIERSTN